MIGHRPAHDWMARSVIPANAGIQVFSLKSVTLETCFRRHDVVVDALWSGYPSDLENLGTMTLHVCFSLDLGRSMFNPPKADKCLLASGEFDVHPKKHSATAHLIPANVTT